MKDNLLRFYRQRADVFPLRTEIDLERFLADAIDQPFATLPSPAKIYLLDELTPHSYGFPVMRSPALDDIDAKLNRWLDAEIASRTGSRANPDEALRAYRTAVIKLAQNALYSSILADYHAVFWLLHSVDVARAFTSLPRRAISAAPTFTREHADVMKYLLAGRWSQTFREAIPELASPARSAFVPADQERKLRLLRLLIDNPFLVAEEFIGNDLRELRPYFAGYLRRDFAECRSWLESVQTALANLMSSDRLFRRAVSILGYPEGPPSLPMMLDSRVQQLLFDHPSFQITFDRSLFDSVSRKLLEYFVVYHLRRGLVWMKSTADGENLADDGKDVAYSRALRPMNFGRRGIVEPIVFRFGLVYDITSFTQTLGEIARGGKEEEQSSYRQMLEFQRDLAEISERNALQFEKFLGDGAFYTARRASRTLAAAIEIQSFYSRARRDGFAFNKGMRIALNYGYYRLLPMQVTADGSEIKEFYGPGIVELSRLTSGKATKEIEDIQHLLLSHGYDQMEVYRFFAPLANTVERNDTAESQREFYAHVNENRHLINEGIVASIPFLKELSNELAEEGQRLYRLTAPWASYIGMPGAIDGGSYVGVRILGSVSLKGIGEVEVAEVVKLAADQADVQLVDDQKPLLHLLQQERYRSVSDVGRSESGTADLVVCQSMENAPVILVGQWDPVAEEILSPVQLDTDDAERFGLSMPITAETVETQSLAYQKLYRVLSRHDTLPSFSVHALRDNVNFSGFIIGATIERI